MKKCIACKIDKPFSEFHKDKSRTDGFANKCKRCRCKYDEVVHKNCKACGDGFIVSGNRKAQIYCGASCQFLNIKYGIDEYLFEDFLISQNYTCAICGEKESVIDNRTGKVYELAVDHCHKTGKVRGLLCMKCNQGLGHFMDNIDRLKSAIEYLKRMG